jgi:Tol biopolymer transport system component
MRTAVALLIAAIPLAVSAQTVVSTTALGPQPTSYESKSYVSPNGQHVAVVKNSGSRRVVSIDGVDGEIFDSIEFVAEATKLNQPHATEPLHVVFSQDGKRYAYAARRGAEYFVVVDGKAFPGGGNQFLFSPDSRRYAYVAGAPRSNERQMVVDGVAGPAVSVATDLQFSDDGKRFIYQGYNGAWFVSVDGKTTAVADRVQSLRVTPNGRRYSYVTTVGGEFVPVIDGTPQASAGRGTSLGEAKLVISADGKRWAFTSIKQANGGYANRAVVDGKEGEAYLRIEDLQFSPDGKRFAYVGTSGTGNRDQHNWVVIDGKRVGLEYNTIRRLQFSPDSKRYAATVVSDAGAFVVVDGVESDAHITETNEVLFSNSGRYAYVARPKEGSTLGYQVIVDGKSDGDISEIMKGTMNFSPDGTRLIYAAHLRYPETFMHIDGRKESFNVQTSAGRISWKQPVVFSPDSKHVAFMSNKESPSVLLVDMQPGAVGLSYAMPTFSADGKHFAVAGQERGSTKWTVFVNGKAVTEVDELLSDFPNTWSFLPDGKLQVVAVEKKTFQRWVIDPQTSTVAAFASNMAKSGKGTPAKTSAKSAKSGSPASAAPTVASADNANQPVVNAAADPASELEENASTVGDKAHEALDKKLKKLKGLLGGKKEK